MLKEAWERHKDAAGLTLRGLGAKIGPSHTTIWRWFTGQSIPDHEEVVSFVAALGIVGEEREAILELARNPGPNLVTTGPPGSRSPLAGVLAHDRAATVMTEWLPLSIPGLLQTEGYARAIIRAANPGMTDEKVDHLVLLRLGRQNALVREEPLRFRALIGVPAVTTVDDDRTVQVMSAQVRHLLRVSDPGQSGSGEAVTIQIVPLDRGWHDGLLGAFVVYEFEPPQSAIVYLEHFRGSLFLDDANDVADYQKLATEITSLAMSPAESRDLMRKQLEQWETT